MSGPRSAAQDREKTGIGRFAGAPWTGPVSRPRLNEEPLRQETENQEGKVLLSVKKE